LPPQEKRRNSTPQRKPNVSDHWAGRRSTAVETKPGKQLGIAQLTRVLTVLSNGRSMYPSIFFVNWCPLRPGEIVRSQYNTPSKSISVFPSITSLNGCLSHGTLSFVAMDEDQRSHGRRSMANGIRCSPTTTAKYPRTTQQPFMRARKAGLFGETCVNHFHPFYSNQFTIKSN
jgi:hypothetical protein